MLCEKCGKNIATTHIKTVVNGRVTERKLCASCAAKEGYSEFGGGGLADMLISMLSGVTPSKTADNTVRCPVCGSAFSDIAKTGKAGCTECYRTFYEQLLPYLKRLHGSVDHVGKIAEVASPAAVPEKNEAEMLRAKLQKLIEEEKYEEAAVVRDQIRELEGDNHE